MPILRGGDDPWRPDRAVLGHVAYEEKMVGTSLLHDGYKIIHTVRDRQGARDRWELYHLESDPAERRDLFKEETDRARELAALLRSLDEEASRDGLPPETVTLDPETERALRGLGYLP